MAAYLTAAQAKARNTRLKDYTDAEIDAKIASFEAVAESFLGYACTARTATETLDVDRTTRDLQVSYGPVTAITSVTVNGTLKAATDYRRRPGGIIRLTYGAWTINVDIVVAYGYGLATTPPLVLDACVEYVDSVLRSERSGTSRDVISQSFDGGITRYSTPDITAGRPTGWLEVDRLLVTQKYQAVPGVA